MAAYVTSDECKVRMPVTELIRLFADKPTPSGVEPAAVDQLIFGPIAERASRDIDGYLRRRYTVPFTTIPEAIKERCIDLVIYYGHQRRSTMPERVRKDRDDTITWLKDCSKGVVDLGLEPVPASNATREVESFAEARVMTRENLSGML